MEYWMQCKGDYFANLLLNWWDNNHKTGQHWSEPFLFVFEEICGFRCKHLRWDDLTTKTFSSVYYILIFTLVTFSGVLSTICAGVQDHVATGMAHISWSHHFMTVFSPHTDTCLVY